MRVRIPLAWVIIKNISKYTSKKTKLIYGFKIVTSYISLINPFLFNHYSYSLYKKLCYENPNEKIYVKQSYMLLTWFYYLNLNLKNTNDNLLKSVKLVMIPKKIKKFTLTKAPIAHKTNSKEQISIIFFSYKIFYRFYNYNFFEMYKFFNSLNEVLLSILITKNTIALTETNLLFLKKNSIYLTFIDNFFFNYSVFIKNNI